MSWSIFCCCNKILKTGNFIKKRSLLCLSFEAKKPQDCAVLKLLQFIAKIRRERETVKGVLTLQKLALVATNIVPPKK